MVLLRKDISRNEDCQVVYPVHLNPNVKKPVKKILGEQKNVFLIDPLEYAEFIYLMDKSYLILTDSGVAPIGLSSSAV